MANDWVVCLSFTQDLTVDDMNILETRLGDFDASLARIPRETTDVTIYTPGSRAMLDAIHTALSTVVGAVGFPPEGLQIEREREYSRRANEPTMPRTLNTAQVGALLGVTRQRVHQLRKTKGFPAPVLEGPRFALWEERSVRAFAKTWKRQTKAARNG